MFNRFFVGLLSVCLAVIALSSPSYAALPFFQGSKKVEADPNQDYYLNDSDGLWFIMVKTFIGDAGREKAKSLVLELRKKYKMQAYLFKLDPEKDDLDELARQNRAIKRYKYQTKPVVEYAVLVGSYPSGDDPAIQKALQTIKRAKPESLSNDSNSNALIEKFADMAKTNKEYAGYGALGGAIVVPNPLIPKEYYSQKGVVDNFIEKINSDSPYNLLNNPRLYTLRVATFSGDTVFQKSWEPDKNLDSQLANAGLMAGALCKALRKRGIDAWEFHDRDSSFVSIGSFDSYGDIRPDGRTEINQDIYQMIEKYKGRHASNGSGAFNTYTVVVEIADGLKKKTMEIPFDVRPVIIMVPQRPENMRKIVKAQKEMEAGQRLLEMQHVEENLLEDGDFNDRRFASNIFRGKTAIEVPANMTIEQVAGNPDAIKSLIATGQVSGNAAPAPVPAGAMPHQASYPQGLPSQQYPMQSTVSQTQAVGQVGSMAMPAPYPGVPANNPQPMAGQPVAPPVGYPQVSPPGYQPMPVPEKTARSSAAPVY